MRRNNQRNASSEGQSRGAFPFRLFSFESNAVCNCRVGLIFLGYVKL